METNTPELPSVAAQKFVETVSKSRECRDCPSGVDPAQTGGDLQCMARAAVMALTVKQKISHVACQDCPRWLRYNWFINRAEPIAEDTPRLRYPEPGITQNVALLGKLIPQPSLNQARGRYLKWASQRSRGKSRVLCHGIFMF